MSYYDKYVFKKSKLINCSSFHISFENNNDNSLLYPCSKNLSYKCWEYKVQFKVKSFNCNLINHLNIRIILLMAADYAFQTEEFLHL